MKKKFLPLALAFVMILALLPAAALAAAEATLTELAVYDCDGTVTPYYQGTARLWTGDSWIFVDQEGKKVMDCAYEQISDLSDGLVRFYIDSAIHPGGGYMNTAGEEVIKFGGTMYTLGCFSEGLAEAGYEGGPYGFIDTTGEYVIPRVYQNVRPFSEGLAAVKQNGKWGYIDKAGQMVIPAQYEKAKEFLEGLAPVQKDGKCGYIDQNGTVVIPFQYDWIEDKRVGPFNHSQDTNLTQQGCFIEGMAMVMRDGRYGFIDKTGREVVGITYETARNFSDGMAAVGDRNYVDKTGAKLNQDSWWYSVGDFYNGLACVRNYRTMTTDLINKRGDVVWSGGFGDDVYYSGGVLFVGEGKGVFTDKMRLYAVSAPELAPEEPMTTVEPIKTGIAYPSTQAVEVDGVAVEFQCYALLDDSGNPTNYIKLRDLADILSGSAAQFEVGWDGNIAITTGQSYTRNGSEQNTPFSGEREYAKTAVKTMVNGQETALDTFQLADDNGGGYTYYKLRDLGVALGFHVDWTADRGIYIETK